MKSTNSSFAAKSSAFFDELSDIVQAKKIDKGKDYQDDAERPFDTLLTQEEEPRPDTYREYQEEDPIVLTRFGHTSGMG